MIINSPLCTIDHRSSKNPYIKKRSDESEDCGRNIMVETVLGKRKAPEPDELPLLDWHKDLDSRIPKRRPLIIGGSDTNKRDELASLLEKIRDVYEKIERYDKTNPTIMDEEDRKTLVMIEKASSHLLDCWMKLMKQSNDISIKRDPEKKRCRLEKELQVQAAMDVNRWTPYLSSLKLIAKRYQNAFVQSDTFNNGFLRRSYSSL